MKYTAACKRPLRPWGWANRDCNSSAPTKTTRLTWKPLARQITADRTAGKIPFCVVANSGTINTGAIDDLNAIADLCQEEKLWFHVDGAIGAVAVLAGSVREQLSGIERADSVALDLHKWMHIPFEAGAVIVRNQAAHRDAFCLTPEYLQHDEEGGGLASGKIWFSEYGLQLTRQFRALKVWMSIREHGLDRFGRMIDRNVEQAHYLGGLVEKEQELELTAPIGLDIVCFRVQPGRDGHRNPERAQQGDPDRIAGRRHRSPFVHDA